MADDSKLRAHADAGVATAERSTQDPLAELARLIGQDDLFDKMRRDAAQAGQDAAAPASKHDETVAEHDETVTEMDAPAPVEMAHEELRCSFDPDLRTVSGRGAYTEPTYDEPEPPTYAAAHRYTEGARPPAGERYSERYDDAPEAAYQPTHAARSGHPDLYYADDPADPHAAAGAYDPAQYYDDTAHAEEPPVPRRRSGYKTIAAILGLAVVGTAGAYGYRSMAGGGTAGQPPVIAGPNTPLKVAAAAPGKEQGSRTTYDRADRGKPEQMVPREEQPLDPPRTASTRAPLATGSAPGLPGVPNQQMATLQPPPGTAATVAGPAAEPKKVKTMTIRPDLSVAPESATARPGTAGRAAARTPAAAAPAQPADPLRAANNPAPTRTASIPTATAGGHMVQISSQSSEEDAQASFKSLQAKYPSVLGGRQPMIRKIDLGDNKGSRYRVQIGPFASADAAKELCKKYEEAGGQCYVLRN